MGYNLLLSFILMLKLSPARPAEAPSKGFVSLLHVPSFSEPFLVFQDNEMFQAHFTLLQGVMAPGS